MKPVEELLSELCHLEIKLWADGETLRCNAPKGVLTPDLREQLKVRKAEILQFLRHSSPESGYSLTPIKPIPHRNQLPLSFAQQRLWFIDQLEPGQSLYNIPFAVRLSGRLNLPALKKAFNTLIERHEVLRTSFKSVAGKPIQVIAPNVTLAFPVVELQEWPEGAKEAEVLQRAYEEVQYPFDLTTAPLLRTILFQLTATEAVLVFTIHHIIADGWSIGILIREIGELYEAFCQGNPSPLPDLPIQYGDFSHWQHQWLESDNFKTQLAYWKQQLGGDLPQLQLANDFKGAKGQTFSGNSQSFFLSSDLTEKLKALSRQEGVTLFMTLLAAFKTLLYRYTEQEDIVIGTPIANRNRAEIEALIGFFVNTLVLRTDLSGQPSFRQLLRRVKEVTLGAYAHQDMPFEKLVEELQPERNLGNTPLFQVMFVLQNMPKTVLSLGDLNVSSLELDRKIAKFDLNLTFTDTSEGLRGILEYKTDLFDSARIDRMIEHFQILLESITTNPDQSLGELSLLSTTEREQILSYHDTAADYPFNSCIQELFEAQVQRTPEAIAVVWEDQQLTYRELNERSNQLAYYLKQRGVKPEVLVGLCLERSHEMIIALLAILKAGGAYLPLDATLPQDRLALMIEQAEVSLLLTQERLLQQLPQTSGEIFCLDTDWQIVAQNSKNNLSRQTTPDHLSYVIYTSGSTGKPKGVMVQHRSLVNHTIAATHHYQITNSDRVLQFASISFDAAAEEIFPTLVQGATLVLRTEEMLSTLPTFLQQCQALALTVLDLPTALWHQLCAELAEGLKLPSSVRLVIIGGESALPNSLAIWQQQVPNSVRLVNSYGPTEATIVATICDLTDRPPENGIPIGKPIKNVQAYVLDSHLNLVPIGVSGELYIGGVGVARGYLNQPTLTAEKFIPNPFDRQPGSRLYKTGDRARYRPDGCLEYLGRIDHQVKLRGFRIELGEIEATLERSPLVRETVVLLREDQPGQKSLVAYVVPQQGQSLVEQELRGFLAKSLPNYMIPSVFVSLEKFPLTPSGKIDRRSLPAPDPNQRLDQKTYVAPRTPVEAKIAEIWANVLGLERISIEDNFFELGGHSLLTTQLLVQIRSAFRVDLPLRSLFESPTVAALSERIDQLNQSKGLLSNSQLERETILADAVLDPSIRLSTEPFVFDSEPIAIFLTGATGFLGAFLLAELLQQTSAQIYCLVRGDSPSAGLEKLQASLKSYLLWQEVWRDRIVPLIGDLSKPLLGFSQEQFNHLAGEIDVIYHNGAWVHHIYPYSVLKKANVLGTQEVLRLASQFKTKPVHFISTVSVFGADGSSAVKVVREHDSLDDLNIPTNGYVQSKWVAEKLVTLAGARGLPVSIYRPGRISGHSQTGVSNPNDFLYRLILGCLQLKMAPTSDILLDLAPVDYVSQAIVYLSRQVSSVGKAFHLLNPHPCSSSKLIDWLRAQDYPIKRVSNDQWQTALLDIAQNSPEHPLYPLVPFFLAKKPQGQASNSGILQFDCQNTLTGLAGSEISCPPISDELLGTYFSSFIDRGVLETPSVLVKN